MYEDRAVSYAYNYNTSLYIEKYKHFKYVASDGVRKYSKACS